MTSEPAGRDHRPQRSAFIPGTPEALDGVVAAPKNHEVVFENERVRVLRVIIQPGEVKNEHTHERPSVFTFTSLTEIKYFNDKGELCLPDRKLEEGVPLRLGPEGMHRVENHGDRILEAIRIEMKG